MGLLSFLFGGKKPAQPQQTGGGGLLAVPTGATQQSYRDYAESCMMKGQQPMPMADWMKQQQLPPPQPQK